ncbi:MAG: PaaI family thioesterase [Lachnospiraceae bacterium]|nr:PaaI family thioesterase [Lachnospiraceae bacterium]
MTKLERAREIFQNDRYATQATGIVIEEVDKNYARVSLKIEDRHLNANNLLMGGVPMVMSDFCFAVASNFENTPTVTLSCTTSFMAGLKGDTLFAEARCLKDGRSTCFYEVSITDDLGTDIAKVSITGHKMLPKA